MRARVGGANIRAMNTPRPIFGPPAPRRFLLLPEESVGGHGQRPRVRRYRLSSVGRRTVANGVEIARARSARGLDGLDRA